MSRSRSHFRIIYLIGFGLSIAANLFWIGSLWMGYDYKSPLRELKHRILQTNTPMVAGRWQQAPMTSKQTNQIVSDPALKQATFDS